MNRLLLSAILASFAPFAILQAQEESSSTEPNTEPQPEPETHGTAPDSVEPGEPSGVMTVTRLESILSEIGGDTVQKTENAVLFEIRGIDMLCVYDENADRMRVISPIKPYTDVTASEKDAIMDANFRGALDGRYASSNGVLYAAYIHPLSSLSREQLLSGIFQVASLRVSFGKEYSSGLMTYGGDRGTEI